LKFQNFSADENGLFWRSLPENDQTYTHVMSNPGRKTSKEKIATAAPAATPVPPSGLDVFQGLASYD
jgi:hypothetical protein